MITKYFLEKDKQANLIDEPSDNRYKSFNTGSVECAIGEFLYGLVRMIKPTKILETGTYKGWSSAYMAQGLKENGFGEIHTVEYEPQHIQTSKELWNKLELQDWITVYQEDSRNFKPPHDKYELILLDSEPQIRFQEFINFYPKLADGGICLIHDLPNNWAQGNVNPDHPEFKSWPWGDCPQEIKDLVEARMIKIVHYPTPRGMSMIYKIKQGDYL